MVMDDNISLDPIDRMYDEAFAPPDPDPDLSPIDDLQEDIETILLDPIAPYYEKSDRIIALLDDLNLLQHLEDR